MNDLVANPELSSSNSQAAPADGVFLFSFETDLSRPVAVEKHGALIEGLFRHFGVGEINIGAGGERGSLNLGFRLLRSSDGTVLFEDRARFNHTTIEAGRWATCSLRVPADVIEFEVEHSLFVDMVREQQYWFRSQTGEHLQFMVSFSDGDLLRREEIEGLQGPTLEVSLINAFARISELEHSERSLLLERDQYRADCDNLRDRLSRNLQNIGLLPPPAAVIAEMIRALNPVQRRDRWLDALTRLGLSGSLFALYPHDGGPGALNILIFGSGGYGDMIYLGVVLRELHEHFGYCNMFVMHESPFVDSVFGSNPHVIGAFSMRSHVRYEFMQLVNSIDIFDLVVEVKYAVTYNAPPLSRVPTTFQQRALYAGGEWQKYVRYDWPHMNNLFANIVIARGMTKLDLVGQSSLLTINRYSDVDLFVPEHAMRMFPLLINKSYVTIHHGADRNMAAAPGLQTKNLSTSTWVEIVRQLRKAGLLVVQLGEKHEIFVTGVDVDLRGETSILETAFVIKTAGVHIDTEGGLVHVARATNTTSVVAFGPTPVGFFGYSQNENIPPKLCGNCWWVTRKWAAECPRGLGVPECMESHSPTNIVERAIIVAGRRPHLRFEPATNHGEAAEPLTISVLLDRVPTLEGSGLILVAPDQDPQEVLDALGDRFADGILLIRARKYQRYYDDLSVHIRVKPYSYGNIPLGSGAYNWAIGVGMDVRNESGLHLAVDLSRCVKPDGHCYLIAANTAQPIPNSEWMDHIGDASKRMQGSRYDIEVIAEPEDEMANYMLIRVVQTIS